MARAQDTYHGDGLLALCKAHSSICPCLSMSQSPLSSLLPPPGTDILIGSAEGLEAAEKRTPACPLVRTSRISSNLAVLEPCPFT
jgi:hypothetical protein